MSLSSLSLLTPHFRPTLRTKVIGIPQSYAAIGTETCPLRWVCPYPSHLSTSGCPAAIRRFTQRSVDKKPRDENTHYHHYSDNGADTGRPAGIGDGESEFLSTFQGMVGVAPCAKTLSISKLLLGWWLALRHNLIIA